MKVKTLIEKLKELPQNADVYHIWDGEPRTKISVVYLSKGGDVMTSSINQVVYSNHARPVNAPTEKEEQYWRT